MKNSLRAVKHVRWFAFGLVAIVVAIAVWVNKDETKRFEEGEEGIPGVLKQMDLWSEMRTYPYEVMPTERFSRTFEGTKRMSMQERMSAMGMYAPATSPWVELGPKNFGGRILSIGFHPTDPNTMWVGAASGGLWKTTNGGRGGAGGINWTFVPTGFPVLGVSSIVVNPLDANEIYIGTGEVYNPGAAGTGSTGAGHFRLFRGSYGIGILKTTNGGTTWTKTLDFTNSSLKGVMDMLIHPTNPDTVFAATTDGVYRTRDGGATWSLIHSVAMPMDMHFKPGNPNVLYVGCGNFQTAGTGIYKSTNANANTPTFTQLTSAVFPSPISGKTMLAISANNPNKIYASIGKDPTYAAHVQGLYVSNDEGATWSSMGNPTVSGTAALGSQGWYGHDIGVSPNNANLVLWGELNFLRSTNGGTSFVQEGLWSMWDINNTTVGDTTEGQSNATNYIHADVHRISPSPHDATGNTFFVCTDGGLFRSTDGGLNWYSLNGGLNTMQIYANMAVHPTNPNYVLLGLQDNEAAVYEGNPGCRRIGNLGDGFHAAMSSDGVIQLVESYYFNRRRSINSGGSWGAGSGAVPTSEVACFNVPMVFSKTASSTYMFAGTVLFKRSTNSGQTWSDLNAGAPIAGANNPCISMVAPTNSIVYFSTAPASGIRSKLWKTTNATMASPTFTEITNGLPDRYYSDIEVDPSDPNRIAVTLSGFGTSHVYLSTNGGIDWCNIGTGLPDVPHNTVMFDPNDASTIYVGNDLGVFYANQAPFGSLGASHDLTWTAYNEGFTDAMMVSDLQVTSTNMLRMGSYGRGLWERAMAPNSAIPVVFKSFKVSVIERGNELNWTVATQSNVDHYDIEYSSDGIHFNAIGSLPAKSGSVDVSYRYLHTIKNTTNGYYRIKIVDLDETFEYSALQVVKAQKMVTRVSAYPNPTTGIFRVQLKTEDKQSITVHIYDQVGRLALLKKINITGNELIIDASKLASGSYQVICENETSRWTTSILKK